MIYSISGKLSNRGENFVVVDIGGVGFKVFLSARTAKSLPRIGEDINLATYLYVREDALELYGFLSESERDFFVQLNAVSGIGPKSALGVLSVARVDELAVAINAGKTELLTRVSGIGRKTAERIVLELKGKIKAGSADSLGTLGRMESDVDAEEALVGLGYTRQQAKEALAKIDPKITKLEDRIKEALKKART